MIQQCVDLVLIIVEPQPHADAAPGCHPVQIIFVALFISFCAVGEGQLTIRLIRKRLGAIDFAEQPHCGSTVLRAVVEHRNRKGAFPWREEQVKVAAPCAPHGPVLVRIARLKTAGSLTRRLSPADIRQRMREMWYKGGAGVS